MRVYTSHSIFLVIMFVSSITALDLTNVYEEESNTLFRQRRQTEEAGSGVPRDFECTDLDSDSQSCSSVVNTTSCACQCKMGYKEISRVPISDSVACFKVKTFVGTATFNETYSGNFTDTKQLVEPALREMFNDKYLVNVSVTALKSGSILASYELYFEYNAAVDTNYVREAFNSNNDCTKTESVVNGLTLDLAKTCRTAVSDTNNALCSGSFQDYCDESSSTCRGSSDGIVTCECKLGFYANQYDPTVCIREICTDNSNCNQPFGWCITTATPNHCKCMWGFMGTHCYAPWMFTLTIVAGGCGIIIIILFLVLVCSKGKKNKASKSMYVSPDSDLRYDFNDFQPGMMRARVPSSNDYITSSYHQEMKATNKESPHSRNNSAVVKNGGHTNLAYDGTIGGGSSSFGSPKRSTTSREPTDYF